MMFGEDAARHRQNYENKTRGTSIHFCRRIKVHRKNAFGFWFLVLPGFEPGLADSKSAVITNYTTEPGGIALS